MTDTTTPSERAGQMTVEERLAAAVLETINRWLHPDLDDWPAWKIDDMVIDVIETVARRSDTVLHDHPRDDLPPLDIVDNRRPCPNCPDKLDLEWDGTRTCPSCGYSDLGAGERGAAIERAAQDVVGDAEYSSDGFLAVVDGAFVASLEEALNAAPMPARGD